MPFSRTASARACPSITGCTSASSTACRASPSSTERAGTSAHRYNPTMKLQFTKMHGAGNDFVVLDGIHQQIDLTPAQWRALASRHFGVGADQILIVEKPTRPDVDFRYRIVNADGSEVEHCGNGARCFVRFVSEKGMTDKRSVRVEV